MNPFKLSQIIIKSIKGLGSEKELQELELWQKRAEEHQIFLDEIRDSEKLASDLSRYNQFDEHKGWKKFAEEKRLYPNHRSLWKTAVSIAAVLVLFVSIGGVIYFMNTMQDTQDKLVESVIKPGSSKAILHVADQNDIALSDSVTASLGTEYEVVAKVDKGQISYGKNLRTSLEMSVEVPYKSEYQFVLSDGTMVWMNAGSKVTFQHPFDGNSRDIRIEGEVFLEVAKDASRPFVVHLPGNNAVEVLGTQFNIKAYPDELYQETVLVEGSILWKSNSGKERILEPGQLLSMNNADNQIEVEEVELYPHIAWKEGRFVYESQTLEAIMNDLSRWYGFNVIYQLSELRELHFSMDVQRYEDLSSILELFELTDKVKFEISDNHITIKEQ